MQCLSTPGGKTSCASVAGGGAGDLDVLDEADDVAAIDLEQQVRPAKRQGEESPEHDRPLGGSAALPEICRREFGHRVERARRHVAIRRAERHELFGGSARGGRRMTARLYFLHERFLQIRNRTHGAAG